PFDSPPSPQGMAVSPAVSKLAESQARALLESSPAFYELPLARQAEMRGNLEKIAAYTAALIQDQWSASKILGQTPVVHEKTTITAPVSEAAAAPASAQANKGPA